MSILQQITIYTRDLELKKLSCYLKYKYKINDHHINYQREYLYLLPYAKHLISSQQNSLDVNESIANYN